MAIPILFDTDGGVDDCTALWYALTDPAVEVVAVTTVRGVVDATQAAANVAKVLHAAGRAEIPIAIGSDDPVGPVPAIASTEMIHGADGLGDCAIEDAPFGPGNEPADELIVRLSSERPGELTLVAVGPFTNVARAVRLDAELPARLAGLVAMGGVAHPPGNALPWGEFNMAFDPAASHAMVHAPWPQPPLMVGLDVTHQATFGDGEFVLLAEERTPAARFLRGPLEFYRRFERQAVPDRDCPAHDLLAVMAVVDPGLLDAPVLPLTVDTGGSAAWGSSVVDLRAATVDVAALPDELAQLAQAVFYDGKARWRVALGVDVQGFRRRARRLFGE